MASATRHDDSAHDLFALYRLVLQAERQLRAPINAAARTHDLAPADVLLLLCCKTAAEGVSQRELARELSISPAQVSARLETLRKRGLLTSARPSADRRKQFWTVTASGAELTARIQRSTEASQRESASAAAESHPDLWQWTAQLAEALAPHDSDRRAA